MSHRYGYAEKNCLFSMPSDLLLTLLTLLLKSHFHHNFRNIMKENLTQLNPSVFVLESANIYTKNIQKHSFPDIPSWCITKLTILFDLHNNKKSLSDSHLIKHTFQELQSRLADYQHIYTDGSKVEDKVGCAYVSGSHHEKICLPDGSSVFTAESKAIMWGIIL